jgi:uncharacterized protein YjlB
MTKFHGSLDELKAAIAACELEGEWSENMQNRFHSFHAESGEVLNWWPSTATVQFQGRRPKEFEALFCNGSAAIGRGPATPADITFSAKLHG